ncbi:MAG: hypothetical protein M0005_11980 [Actinomycetota bacterium]|nr:hypothetical protein [Actinomycetota bacterium]
MRLTDPFSTELSAQRRLEIRDGVIQTVRGIVNPDKLGHLGPVSDIARIRHRNEYRAS